MQDSGARRSRVLLGFQWPPACWSIPCEAKDRAPPPAPATTEEEGQCSEASLGLKLTHPTLGALH